MSAPNVSSSLMFSEAIMESVVPRCISCFSQHVEERKSSYSDPKRSRRNAVTICTGFRQERDRIICVCGHDQSNHVAPGEGKVMRDKVIEMFQDYAPSVKLDLSKQTVKLLDSLSNNQVALLKKGTFADVAFRVRKVSRVAQSERGLDDESDADTDDDVKLGIEYESDNESGDGVPYELVRAHKCILAARSEVFQKMFELPMKETQTQIVDMRDVTKDVLNAFLVYLYSYKLPRKNMVEAVFTLAHTYQVDDLLEACSNALASQLTRFNAIRYIIMAHRYGDKCEVLLREAAQLISSQFRYFADHEEFNESVLTKPEVMKVILGVKVAKKLNNGCECCCYRCKDRGIGLPSLGPCEHKCRHFERMPRRSSSSDGWDVSSRGRNWDASSRGRNWDVSSRSRSRSRSRRF